jgi:hypothetical protein
MMFLISKIVRYSMQDQYFMHFYVKDKQMIHAVLDQSLIAVY